MKFNDIKIGKRLTIGYGALILLLVVLAAFTIGVVRESIADRAAMVEINRRASLADEWVASTRLNITRVMALAKSGNDPQVDAYFKPMIAKTSGRISEVQKELTASAATEKGKSLLDDIAQQRSGYVETRKAYFDLLASADPAAETMLNEKLLPSAEAYLGAMEKFQAHQLSLVEEAIEQAKAEARTETVGVIAIAVVAVLFGMLVAWQATHSVTAPLRDAVHAANAVASGDLSYDIASDRRDELGDLLRSLGAMKDSLLNTVRQVRETTDSIGTASAQIATGNQDLSARTEQTASNLQQTASSMEELTSTVRQSADAARQANQLAASATEIAQRGGTVVAQVVTTMDEINHSSKKISDIIGVIDGIAFQTNILALNAAVEAARAGEQGRGFAVVAGEVRNLAQRSAEAAKEIKGLIGTSVDKVEAGSRLVADAGQTMSEIVGSVQRVTDIIGEISAAAGEQSDGIGQVNTAVNQLDQMTQQNAALVEESAAAAESLKDQARRLAQVVAVFRLRAG